MTEHQILLVQTSFTRLVDDIDDVARIFFEKLFELDPTLRPMFPDEIQVQGRKMFRTLLVIVNALSYFDRRVAPAACGENWAYLPLIHHQ